MTRDELVDAILDELRQEVGSKLFDERKLKARELAERVADRFRLGTDAPRLTIAPHCYDLRHEQDYLYPQGARKAKLVGGKVLKRRPKDITHIVFHQTAVEYGVSSSQVKASGGDRELALARRALDVACHVFASRSGFYVLTHELVDHLNHGNGYNAYSIGIEIDGRYSGLEDDPTTVAREDLLTTWKGEPTLLTDTTVEAAKAAIRDVVRSGRALGMPLTTAVAHRQSSGTRRSDPGQAIWQRIVIPLVEELGLEVELDRALKSPSSGDGRPIPRAWDPHGIGDY